MPVTNNPYAKYNDRARVDCNLELLLWQLVRASTAVPFNINWKTGVDNMLIVSVGTGSAASTQHGVEADELWLLDHAKSVPSALMNAASAGWDATCRLLGEAYAEKYVDLKHLGPLAAG